MTDQEKIMTLRDALSGVKYQISKPGWWGHIVESVDEALAATAPEPVKPWWETEGLNAVEMAGSKALLFGGERVKFYAAAPLMAKALLAVARGMRCGALPFEEQGPVGQAVCAALDAAGVEVPE